MTDPDLNTEMAPPGMGSSQPVSISLLQSEVRQLFLMYEPPEAMRRALGVIGGCLHGEYLVMHAGFEAQVFTEEWHDEFFTVPEQLREVVNNALMEAMGEEQSRCMRLGGDPNLAPAVLAAPVFDAHYEVVGGAAIVLGACDRGRAMEVLIHFEGLLGLLAALASERHALREESQDQGLMIPDDARAAHGSPLYLAFAMVARLKNRHQLDQAALGFVRGKRIEIAAVSGLEDVRGSNPGVQLIVAAMEECLDRGTPVAFAGFLMAGEAQEVPENAHLHASWSKALGGDAVASFPIHENGRITAVMSLRCEAGRQIGDEDLQALAAEMEPYSALLPITRAAGRGLRQHAKDKIHAGLQGLLGAQAGTKLAMAMLLCCLLWLAFGHMHYSFTVPCTVIPAQPRQVAAPREGVLVEVLVRPGDRVQEGQVLARLDDVDDRLEAASLAADIRRLEALMDTARAESRPGDLRVHETERAAVQAQHALVQQRIAAAQIRAPRAGMVMVGDLRQSVGGRVAIGMPLFQIAERHAVQVELQIPEDQVWDAQDAAGATFAPRGRPEDRIGLDGLRILPQGEPGARGNSFRARSSGFEPPEGLLPGMEGFVRVDAGSRPVWWILTHRITDWLRLRFWM